MVVRIAQVLGVVIAGLALGGCASSGFGPLQESHASMPVVPTPTSSPSSATQQTIDGHWRLVGGTDATGPMDLDSAVVTLTIDGADSGGQAPCNSYGVTISGDSVGTVTIRPGIHTDMACQDPERTALESRYLASLPTISSAHFHGQELVLDGPNVQLDYMPSAASS
jgi:heat shock protein HslJ